MNTHTKSNLKPQTVYTVSTNGRSNLQLMEDGERVCSLKFNAEKICLSKEELVELLDRAFVAGNERGWSGYPNTENHTNPTKEQFINSLFNQ